MPLLYDTRLGDRGESLSGGQRQRVALARALLVKPAILVLDEATSALDSQTEAAIYQSLAQLSRTRIVVAHCLSTVVKSDWIFVVDQGRVVDAGRHADLLGRGVLYSQLVAASGASGVWA
jgi:ATP-binding cassette subfamily B protein